MSESQPTVLLPRPSDRILKRGPAVPADPFDAAARRFPVLALVLGLGCLLELALDVGTAGFAGPPNPEDVWIAGAGAVLSLAVYLATRRRRIATRRLLDVALGYQVVLALMISVAEAMTSWQPGQPVWGISWVCVLIVIFPVFLPNRTVPAIVAAVLSAASGPAAYLAVGRLSGRATNLFDLANCYTPNAIALLIAVAVIFFVGRTGRQIAAARRLGSYRLVERIASGGMGEVWKAEHAMLARPAAVKLLRADRAPAGSGDPELHVRFRKEAEATASLTSAHTVTLFDYGITGDGTPYYAMELLDGMDLQKLVERHGPMSPGRAAFLLVQACESLEEAHRAGFVHGDVKPGNLFLCRSGVRADFVKVLDFGLVRVVGPGERPAAPGGTPGYLAPEVLDGEDASPMSDIYALGCVAWWLVRGRLFTSENRPVSGARAGSRAESRDARSAAAGDAGILDSIIFRCLDDDPAARPRSCRELRDHLLSVAWADPWSLDRAAAWWAGEGGPSATPG